MREYRIVKFSDCTPPVYVPMVRDLDGKDYPITNANGEVLYVLPSADLIRMIMDNKYPPFVEVID